MMRSKFDRCSAPNSTGASLRIRQVLRSACELGITKLVVKGMEPGYLPFQVMVALERYTIITWRSLLCVSLASLLFAVLPAFI